jgi:hypothetical protein
VPSADRNALTPEDLAVAYSWRQHGRSWGYIRNALIMRNSAASGLTDWDARTMTVRYGETMGLPSLVRSAPRRSGSPTARSRRRTASPSGLTFGVEIEFRRPTDRGGYLLDVQVIAQAVRDAGIECHAEDYNHHTRPHWKIVYDGSSDQELVSPILSGEDGLEQVRKVMEVLRNLECRVTRSEGMHVHVGARGFSPVQIARLAAAYTANSSLFDAVVSRTRRSGGSGARWCNHLSDREVSRITSAAVGGDILRIDRYRSVNLYAYHQHGTVEFRQHQGTLNGTKATAWVRLLLAFVTHVIAADAVPTWDTLPAMAEAISLETAASRYLARRQRALAPPEPVVAEPVESHVMEPMEHAYPLTTDPVEADLIDNVIRNNPALYGTDLTAEIDRALAAHRSARTAVFSGNLS